MHKDVSICQNSVVIIMCAYNFCKQYQTEIFKRMQASEVRAGDLRRRYTGNSQCSTESLIKLFIKKKLSVGIRHYS
jgi:hypothetical protein